METSVAIENAFTDYNDIGPHSSIGYLPPMEFRRKFLNDLSLREGYTRKLEAKIHEKWGKMLQFSGLKIAFLCCDQRVQKNNVKRSIAGLDCSELRKWKISNYDNSVSSNNWNHIIDYNSKYSKGFCWEGVTKIQITIYGSAYSSFSSATGARLCG